jgi:hypothetical protein
MPLTVKPPTRPSFNVPLTNADGTPSPAWLKYFDELDRYLETLRAAIP